MKIVYFDGKVILPWMARNSRAYAAGECFDVPAISDFTIVVCRVDGVFQYVVVVHQSDRV